jgi:D-sedoheptulose 7-phosphate isomerase
MGSIEMSTIAQHLKDSSRVKEQAAAQTGDAERVASEIVRALRGGHKLVIFGNGGSAADAQHFAAELVGRFEKERAGLPAIALTTDTSAITAIANDFGYDDVFSRQVQALVKAGDVVVGISTSGNAKSVLKGIEEAKKLNAWTAGLSGMTGGKLKAVVDCCITVPSERTAHIQETHIALIHAICATVDAAFITTRV